MPDHAFAGMPEEPQRVLGTDAWPYGVGDPIRIGALFADNDNRRRSAELSD